uniref:Mitochondrial import inner membrane translocase subunit Tim10 family protein n=1 Tax=Rhizophora mucronata TaxID=61149 RepID=A0A2P2JXV3_RHIMU
MKKVLEFGSDYLSVKARMHHLQLVLCKIKSLRTGKLVWLLKSNVYILGFIYKNVLIFLVTGIILAFDSPLGNK